MLLTDGAEQPGTEGCVLAGTARVVITVLAVALIESVDKGCCTYSHLAAVSAAHRHAAVAHCVHGAAAIHHHLRTRSGGVAGSRAAGKRNKGRIAGHNLPATWLCCSAPRVAIWTPPVCPCATCARPLRPPPAGSEATAPLARAWAACRATRK